MTDDPIYLDGRRTAAGQLESEMRRRAANSRSTVPSSGQPHLESLTDQMLAEPAKTWIEFVEKWQFLLDRYQATPEASDIRIQELIRRAHADMERLRKQEEPR